MNVIVQISLGVMRMRHGHTACSITRVHYNVYVYLHGTQWNADNNNEGGGVGEGYCIDYKSHEYLSRV